MNSLTHLSLKRYFVCSAICLVVFLIAWYDTVHTHRYSQFFNEWFLHYCYVPPLAFTDHEWQRVYREALEGITALGADSIFLLVMGTILLDLLLRREFLALLYCILVTLVIMGLTEMCKQFIYSPRPMFMLEFDSFPSGHTVRISICCGVLILLGQMRVFNLTKYWQGVLLVIPLLVGYSRMSLGRHWLSDVLASYSLCILGFLIVFYLIKNIGTNGMVPTHLLKGFAMSQNDKIIH